MAKINLLTIHWGNCYGAVMQTLATCQILRELGHDVSVINLIPKGSWKKYINLKSWAFILQDFQFYKFKHRYFKFMTRRMSRVKKSMLPRADFTVVGSDQVWNKDITGYLSKDFFLSFLDDADKRFSLASSFGKYKWTEDERCTSEVKCALKKFLKVSTREDSGIEICKNIFEVEAVQLIDPTLVCETFTNLVKKEKEQIAIYTFLYHQNEKVMRILDLFECESKLPMLKRCYFSIVLHSGPLDWLNNIYNSRFVITDSFHCVAFCIIFKKQFAVVCGNRSQFTRIESLLTLLQLQNRIVDSPDRIKIAEIVNNKIDYNPVSKILELEAERYKQFVNEVMS